MSATATGNTRLRQIAILLSSVDSVTARQLLLHLPTETARQVRALAGKLGPVSAEEKRRILADFQRTAAANPTEQATQPQTSAHTDTQTSPYATAGNYPPQAYDQLQNNAASEHATASDTKWGNLSSLGLLKFLRGERPAVIAVVVSQLSPTLAVQVLQDLPGTVNQEVLQRMAGLGEIDPDALSSIEEYVSERLEEYQKTKRSELENQRRIDALLAAAPTALREQWQLALKGDEESQTKTPAQPQATATPPSPQRQETEPTPPAVLAAQHISDSFETQQQVASSVNTGNSDNMEAGATILPFPRQTENAQANTPVPANRTYAADSSLIRLEFESLLELPPEKLAMVLSEPDSQTVLLALAGATPSFMQRFYDMLRPEDAIALKNRLSEIGAIHLRDIDSAQQQLIELAANLVEQSGRSAAEESRHRQAA